MGWTRVDWVCWPLVCLRGGDEDSATVPSRELLWSIGPSRRLWDLHRGDVCSRIDLDGRGRGGPGASQDASEFNRRVVIVTRDHHKRLSSGRS